MKTDGQKWVLRRLSEVISAVEYTTENIDLNHYSNPKSFVVDVYDQAIDIVCENELRELNNDLYSSVIDTMDGVFKNQLVEYYIEIMGEPLNESFDKILDLYNKRKDGETLRPSEETMMRSFKKFIDKGGNAEEFIYDDRGSDYDIDEREGEKFVWENHGMKLTFTFSNEEEINDEIEYYGEITYMEDEFLGVISTDKRGYITDYDFYSVLSDEDVRLQNILKKSGLESEIINFFSEEVIPNLRG